MPEPVVVVGGGVAAAEAARALRARGVEVDHVRDAAVVAVVADERRVRLASGEGRAYATLVLALGARARAAIPGAGSLEDAAAALAEVRAGAAHSLCFAIPAGVSWSLPVYELALRAADEAWTAKLTIVTPEPQALDAFGGEASAFAAGLLDDLGIRLVTGAVPRAADRHGLRLADGGTIPADRVVAAPALVGTRVAGVPADFGGFVRTDRDGRVPGLDGVYAAGGMTAFPVKEPGVAAQQGLAVAAAIAGAVRPDPHLVLRAELATPDGPALLRTTLDEAGRPITTPQILEAA